MFKTDNADIFSHTFNDNNLKMVSDDYRNIIKILENEEAENLVTSKDFIYKVNTLLKDIEDNKLELNQKVYAARERILIYEGIERQLKERLNKVVKLNEGLFSEIPF